MVLSQIRSIKLKSTLEITPDVYQLTIGGTNIILIAEEELTLVDTGFPGSSAQLIDLIHKLGRSVEEIRLIILTHSHIDHAGGLADLRKLIQVKVAAHQADIGDTESQMYYPEVIRKLLRIPPFSALRSIISVKPSEVDMQLEGGEVLEPLGGLKVVHTPGHTPGSISLFSPTNKLLIVGDALNEHRGTLRLPPKRVSTDLAQAIDSVKRMARLDFDILCIGHGQPLAEDARSKLQDLIEKIKD